MNGIKRSCLFLFLLLTLAFAAGCSKPSELPRTVSLIYLADEGGFISGNVFQQTEEGGSGWEVEAIPREGYVFSSWSDGGTDAKRREEEVRQDCVLTAFFSKQTYCLIYEKREGGRIEGVLRQSVSYLDAGETVTAIPDEHYEFVRWSDGLRDASRKDEAVRGDLTVFPEFRKETFSVTYRANGGKVSSDLASPKTFVAELDRTITYTARPDVGYRFVGWDDGVLSQTRADDFSRAGMVFTANFEKDYLNLPVFDIVTKEEAPITDKVTYVSCSVSLSNAGEFEFSDQTAGIRLRGNTTQWLPKKPYRLKFDSKISPFGWAKNKSWVLLAMYLDHSDIKDYTAFALAQSVVSVGDAGGAFVPNARHVEVYLNGVFQGLYLFTDQPDENEGRTGVKADFTAEDSDIPFYVEWDENTQIEGEEGRDWFRIENADSGVTSFFEVKYPEADERASQAQFDYVKTYIETVNSLCHDPSTTREQFEAYVDLPAFVDFYLVQELTGQTEINWKSIHMSKEKGGKLKMGPVWDFDWAFGGPMNEESRGDNIPQEWMSCTNWFFYMLQKNWFASLVKARWEEIRPTVETTLVSIQAYKNTIREAALRNRGLWVSDPERRFFDFDEAYRFVTETFFAWRIPRMDELIAAAVGEMQA